MAEEVILYEQRFNCCEGLNDAFIVQYALISVIHDEFRYMHNNEGPAYGIRLAKKTDGSDIYETSAYNDITASRIRAEEILHTLYENKVTPLTLKEILYEIL